MTFQEFSSAISTLPSLGRHALDWDAEEQALGHAGDFFASSEVQWQSD